jgi:hypothetical protein
VGVGVGGGEAAKGLAEGDGSWVVVVAEGLGAEGAVLKSDRKQGPFAGALTEPTLPKFES